MFISGTEPPQMYTTAKPSWIHAIVIRNRNQVVGHGWGKRRRGQYEDSRKLQTKKVETNDCTDSEFKNLMIWVGILQQEFLAKNLLFHLKYDAMYKYWAFTFMKNKSTLGPGCRVATVGYGWLTELPFSFQWNNDSVSECESFYIDSDCQGHKTRCDSRKGKNV